MIDSLSLDSDFAALLRAGCQISFHPLPAAFDGVSVRAVITPAAGSVGDEIASRVARGMAVPLVFVFTPGDVDALARGLRQARRLFVCDLESLRPLLS